MLWYSLVLLVVGFTWADNEVELFNCPEHMSQKSLGLHLILGKWYVVEILDHKYDPLKPVSTEPITLETCPIVTLELITQPYHDTSVLKLLWTEEAGNSEYNLRMPDVSRNPGYWLSEYPQNGSLVTPKYNQFLGSIHVMKAVASHMVLTFCSRHPETQLYSLLLARKHLLDKTSSTGLHDLLERRKLKIISIRKTCVNGGAGSLTGTRILVGSTVLLSVLITCFASWQ